MFKINRSQSASSSLWQASLTSVLLLLGPTTQAQDFKAGLVAYWNLDGNPKDSVGIFNGTENGTDAIPYVAGKPGFGKAIQLDGVDQWIEITGGEPDDLAFAGANMSIAGWFKVGTFDKSWQALVAKGEGQNWRMHRRGGEQGLAWDGGPADTPAGKEIGEGDWHHFVGVSDTTAANFGTALYIDGVLDTKLEATPNLASNGQRMAIGDNPGARRRFWNGLIDDIAIWDRVLTEPEITKLYNGGVGKPLSELLGGTVVDTDKDGMPDSYEIANGFKPNDPSDAAKDFDKDGATNLEEYKAGTDPIDVTKPTVVSASATGTFTTVNVTFSEELDPVTAANPANYTITPSVAVTAAVYKKKVVTLTTAAQTPGATKYTVKVTGVTDLSKNAVVANNTAVFYSYLLITGGVAQFNYYGGIGGNAVDALTGDPRYPATPDYTIPVFSLNLRDAFPDNSHEAYGGQIVGLLTPKVSGDYVFFLTTDDGGALYLSTDEKPANKKQIAAETAWSGDGQFITSGGSSDLTSKRSDQYGGTEWPTAAKISLVAGKAYYIESLHKEGGGGDVNQVAWKLASQASDDGLVPIPGGFLTALSGVPAAP
ncbi:MAG: hypothetical protein EXS36_19005, partial [Pedosphaera sp.]|nr:hypothetical protein [Pedosphaera sp.]